MLSRASAVAALVCVGLVGFVPAQPADDTPDPASPFRQEEEEPTLPEVLVRPDDVEPDYPPPAESTSSPYDLPLSYPSLFQQQFEGLDSALRSNVSVFDSPQAVSIVDLQNLTERQPSNMIEALEREVGVLMQRTGNGQASPFVRGLTGNQTLILVDGIRMNNSTFRFGPNQYFATVDPGMIQRIEVVRGPQSVLFGSDAIGGVINVITRSARTGIGDYLGGQFVERYTTADSSSYTRLNVEASRRQLGVFAGGSYLNANDLYRGGDLGTQPFTGYSQYAGDVKFDYLLADDQLLTVSLQHHEQMDVPRTDKWPGESRLFDPQQRNLGYIRWQGRDVGGVLDAFMFTASFARQKEGTLKRKPPTSLLEDRSEFNVNTTGLTLVLTSELSWLGRLTYGVDWYHDDVTANKFRHDLSGALPPSPRLAQFPDDSQYERVGAFLQWETDVTERLSATSGVRFSNIEAGATVALFDPDDLGAPPVDTPIAPNFQDWTASVGLSYELNPCLRLVGSVGEGFRAPSLDELTSVSDNVNEGIDIPNPDLGPETSINYEVGLKADYERIRAQSFVFWTDLDDLSVREVVGQIPDPDSLGDTIDLLSRRNVGSAQVQGFELAGEYLFTPQWSTYGNLTYIYGQNATDDEPLSRTPPTQGLICLRWRDRCARNWVEVYGWLVGRQDRLSARDIRDSRIPADGTPGYATLNLRLGSRVGESQRVTLGLENITNKAYRVHGSGVDGPGISGHIGYELLY